MREDEHPENKDMSFPDDAEYSLAPDEGKSFTLYRLHIQKRILNVFQHVYNLYYFNCTQIMNCNSDTTFCNYRSLLSYYWM